MNTSLPWQTQRAIREGMSFSAVVDINGVHNPKTGGFHVVQDAIDAGHKSIFVRDGTYPYVDVTGVDDLCIVGESWGAIIDGATDADAMEFNTCDRLIVQNLTVRTTAGGGSAYNGFDLNSCDDGSYHRLNCDASDNRGLYQGACKRNIFVDCRADSCDDSGFGVDGLGAEEATFIGCRASNCGTMGFYLSSSVADDTIMVACRAVDNGTYGVDIDVSSENCVIVGNRLTGNSTANSRDLSGTSTLIGNDET